MTSTENPADWTDEEFQEVADWAEARIAENKELVPLDVWFKFTDWDEELATYEANTFERDGKFVVEWYHNDVGLVTQKWFDTYEDAIAWYDSEGFEDYSPGEE